MSSLLISINFYILQLTCDNLNASVELRSVISDCNGAVVRKKGNSPERTFHYVRART